MTANQPFPACLSRPDAGGHFQTRTPQTETRYRKRFASMIRTLCKQHGKTAADAMDPAINLGERAHRYTANTLKHYHGAIRQNLRDRCDDASITLDEIEVVDELLRTHRPAPKSKKCRKASTSASRAKSVRLEQISAIVAVLLRKPTPIRQIAAGMLDHGVMLLTRPGEFLTIKPDPQNRFWVRSAKYSEANRRGLQPARIVPTDDYEEWEVDELKHLSSLIYAKRAKGATTSKLLRRCQRAIRLARQAVGGRSRRVAPYTVRHQGRANLAAMGMAAEAVAVVMGHASAGTAQSHYSPARCGWRGMHVTLPTVDAQLLGRVRPAHPSRGWDAGRTLAPVYQPGFNRPRE